MRGARGAGHIKHPETLGDSAPSQGILEKEISSEASIGSCHARHRFQAIEPESLFSLTWKKQGSVGSCGGSEPSGV